MGAIARLTKAAVRPLVKGLPVPSSSYTSGSWSWALSRAHIEESWRGSVGDGSHTSIVEACINYMARTFPEAPPAVWQTKRDGTREVVPDHPLVALLRRPNPYHSGPLLWAATLASWVVSGNAYWVKVRSGATGGRVVQLWYVPHWMIAPKSDDDANVYISHYEYRPRGAPIRLAPSDVIHFRHGIDDEDVRLGRSPIADQLRDVFVDEEASRFTAALIRNYGVPGLVLAPEGDATLAPDEQEAAKKSLMQKTGGESRGEPIVLNVGMKVSQFGFSPQQLDLSGLRDIPEERVTSALGLPASVVGFGSGLQTAKVGATMRELREQAWEGCIIPTQRIFAADLSVQLLPEFVAPSALAMTDLGFDLAQVRVLQEDENHRVERDVKVWLAGGMTRAELRGPRGLEVTPADDVYAIPLGVTLTPRDEVVETEEPEPIEAPAAPLALAAENERSEEGAERPADGEEDEAGPKGRRRRKRAAPPVTDATLAAVEAMRATLARSAALRTEEKGERAELREAMQTIERTTAAQGAAFVEGMKHVAEAIAMRPTELVITPASQPTTVDEIERDERGNVRRIIRRPVEAASQNGSHA